MKKIAAIALALLCIAGAVRLFCINYCESFVSAHVYNARKDAETKIEAGWLPDFLPSSARNLHLKIHSSHNQVLASFLFDPEIDNSFIDLGTELLKQDLATVHPSTICRKEPWFPNAITAGRYQQLTPVGFRLFKSIPSGQVNHGEISHWYALVNMDAGICYLWAGFD
jgi:hypothetical protein